MQHAMEASAHFSHEAGQAFNRLLVFLRCLRTLHRLLRPREHHLPACDTTARTDGQSSTPMESCSHVGERWLCERGVGEEKQGKRRTAQQPGA